MSTKNRINVREFEEPIPTKNEINKQRENRARAFKLKKCIMSIENQPVKSTQMEQKLEEYYNQLKTLQSERSSSNEKAASTIIENIRTKIRKNNSTNW